MNRPALSSPLRRVILLAQQQGFLRAVVRIFQKLPSPFLKFGTITFFVQDLRFTPPERHSTLEAAMVRASSLEFDTYRECDPSLPNAVMQQRFRLGDTCFVALDGQGKIVHSHWVSTTRANIPELGMDLILGPREAYMYNATTREDLRGNGLFPAVRSFFIKRLHADGVERLFFYVRGDNYVGLKAEGRWLRSPGKFWYVEARGLKPLVVGRRSPELPRMIRTAREGRMRKGPLTA